MTLRPASAASSALTLAEAKAHLRVNFDDDDDYISSLGLAATAWANKWLGISLGSEREWTLALDDFPLGKLTLPVPYLISVESVAYTALDGDAATYAGFRVFGVETEKPGYILPVIDEAWPDTASEPEAVTVSFTAGIADIPAPIRHALLLLVGHWYENREAASDIKIETLPLAVDALLMPYRSWTA